MNRSLAGGQGVHRAFLEHTKCPDAFLQKLETSIVGETEGFFRLDGMHLYGRANGGEKRRTYTKEPPGVDELVSRNGTEVRLPFHPTEIIDNLRLEKYAAAVNEKTTYWTDQESFSRKIYYLLRPLLPIPFRRILQRIALQDWEAIPFPTWPVDTTVEDLMHWLFRTALEASEEKEIPFIWYWPKEYLSCAIMTHDVETGEGQDFCKAILKMEAEYGIKSAFQFVPEVRYSISEQIIQAVWQAGSEVGVQGLNHDDKLFSSEELFRNQAEIINEYGKRWGAKGFRSPIMYRNQAWYDALKFSYDMSVPNVAHLDPQRGGCCTVFPYFIGDILELPLTTIQDYAIYHFVRRDPLELWKQQMDAIRAKHGLVSFIIHPDYTMTRSKQKLYRRLLELLKKEGEEKKMWLALPGEVDKWWRERSGMSLVQKDGQWKIEGEGSERACLAYAGLQNGKLTFKLPDGSREMA